MLSSRFANDGKPMVPMSAVQLEAKAEVEKKISSKIYQFEESNCLLCSGNQLELLAEKDRYGLYSPVKICRDCGLIQQTPRMNQKSYNQFYDCEYRRLYGSANISKDVFFKSQCNFGAFFLKSFLKDNLLKKSPDSTLILEVGCGAGGILKPFKDKGYRVKGIDLGKDFLDYGINCHGLDLEQGSLDSVKFDKKPDVIIYSHVFEHVLDPMAELQSIRNILADDGLLFIDVPGIKWVFHSKSYKGNLMKYLQNAHICHFSFRTISNMLLKSGFKPVLGSENVRLAAYKSAPLEGDIKSDYHDVMEYLIKLNKFYELSQNL